MVNKSASLASAAALAFTLALPLGVFSGIDEAGARGFDGENGPNLEERRKRLENYRNNAGTSGNRQQRRSFFDFLSPTRYRATGAEPELPPAPPPVKTYFADKQFSLIDSNLEQPGGEPLDDSLAQTIFHTLKTGGSGVRLTKKQRQAVLDFYAGRTYAPVWTEMDGVLTRAKWVNPVLKAAAEEGLEARDYRISAIEEANGDFDVIESDLTKLAVFDIQLTAMALRYANHAYGGKIAPNRLSGYHDLKGNHLDNAGALAKLAEIATPDVYLMSLHPIHPAYKAFRKALAKTTAKTSQQEEITVIPTRGGLIRPGDTDARVGLLRQRLSELGLYAAETPADGDSGTTASADIYDEELVEAVRDFQRDAGLSVDAVIGPATLRAMNGDSRDNNSTEKLVLNMERLRWLPRHLGKRHVFVNQADYKLEVRDNGKRLWQTRVIVGKARHQTAFFSDEMETVVFNPYWGVPQSIIINEMLPYLVRDRRYLDRQDYELTNSRGKVIRSSSVDWRSYLGRRQVPFGVRQRPGAKNALGEIKFLFPNKHAIYLHDTPTRHLFEKNARAFSHGCVRVKDPRKFAEFMLRWDRSEIDSAIAAGKNRKVTLKRKIPVHLAYFTAWPDSNGKIRYMKDIYSRDNLIQRAMHATKLAMR